MVTYVATLDVPRQDIFVRGTHSVYRVQELEPVGRYGVDCRDVLTGLAERSTFSVCSPASWND
ncbi:hypothetical protein GCM10022206_68210 [Streptomyces chiangmaiensis]